MTIYYRTIPPNCVYAFVLKFAAIAFGRQLISRAVLECGRFIDNWIVVNALVTVEPVIFSFLLCHKLDGSVGRIILKANFLNFSSHRSRLRIK